MDYNKLVSGEKNEVLAYVVFKEHTLGYLFCLGKTLYLGMLHPSVLRGSPWNLLTGNVIINTFDFEHVRKATEKDFDDYRVLSKGYNLAQFSSRET